MRKCAEAVLLSVFSALEQRHCDVKGKPALGGVLLCCGRCEHAVFSAVQRL